MGTKPVIGIYGVLEETEQGGENARVLLGLVRKQLTGLGLQAVPAPEVVRNNATMRAVAQYFRQHSPDLLLAVIVTWSFDHFTLSILDEVQRPLAILAVPGVRSGSLVGAQQLGSLLTDMQIPYEAFFGAPDDPKTYNSLAAYARAAAAARQLRRSKAVFFGRRTPGMTPIAFDEIDLAKRFGLQVVSFGWDEVEAVARRISPARVRSVVRRLHGSAGKITSTPESLADSARLYLAIKFMTEKERGIIAALGCYPHYAGRVCVAAGLLNDDGLAAPCEGDLNSGIVMHLLQTFTGRPALFGEMLDVNQKDNSIITSHCGSGPTKLAQNARDVQLCPVRLFERGAAIRFPAQGGPATYVNLAGRHDNYRMCSIEGKAVPSGMVFEGNPVKFKPDVPVKSVLDTVAEQGFGHHWMLGYGRVAQELAYFCKLTGIKSMCLA